MGFEDSLNDCLDAMWTKFFSDQRDVYIPTYFDTLKKNCPLFIGMNPSFSMRNFKKTVPNFTENEISDSYKWNGKNERNLSVDHGKESKDKLNFFKKFADIANEAGFEKWEHIDLFQYRMTSQTEFKKIIFEDKKETTLNQFGKEQLKLAWHLIEYIAPSFILIANAKASDIFLDYFESELEFSEVKCLHYMRINSNKTPVFFSSMLSGQRALDRYSVDRLTWHIKTIIAT